MDDRKHEETLREEYERKFKKLTSAELLERLVKYEEQMCELQIKRQVACRLYAQRINNQNLLGSSGGEFKSIKQAAQEKTSPKAVRTFQPVVKKPISEKPATKTTEAPEKPSAKKQKRVEEEQIDTTKRRAKLEAVAISRILHDIQETEVSSSDKEESSDEDEIVAIPQSKGSSKKNTSAIVDEDESDSGLTTKEKNKMIHSKALRAHKNAIMRIFETSKFRSSSDSDFMHCEYSERSKHWIVPADRKREVIPQVRGRGVKSQQGFSMYYKDILVCGSLFNEPPEPFFREDPRDFNEIKAKIESLLQGSNELG